MGTHYQGSDTEKRALEAYIKLARASNSVISTVHRSAYGGFTVSQFGVLEALHHLGPLCQVDIGAKLLKSGGNITMVIDNLEKQGLVKRTRDANDRRRMMVDLTPVGRERIAEQLPKVVAAIVNALGQLTPDEQNELGRLCRKLGRKLGQGQTQDKG